MSAATAPAVIELSGITKHYRMGDTEVPALRGIDIAIPAGAFVAVKGPSGSGKSTLLNICGLLDTFDQGRYRLGGEDVSSLDEIARTLIRRRRIGFVFQVVALMRELGASHGATFLIATHDERMTSRCDEVRTMTDGVLQ